MGKASRIKRQRLRDPRDSGESDFWETLTKLNPDRMRQDCPGDEIWENSVYLAMATVRQGHVKFIQVQRQDGKAVRDWRDMQRIKNQIAGEEIDAYELYPPESELADSGNTYWIWCYPPGERAPFRITREAGFAHEGRFVHQPDELDPDTRIPQRAGLTSLAEDTAGMQRMQERLQYAIDNPDELISLEDYLQAASTEEQSPQGQQGQEG